MRDRGRRAGRRHGRRAVDLPAKLVHREPRALLRLEAAVHVELAVRRGDEDRRQAADDDRQDRDDRDELDERVAGLGREACADAANQDAASRTDVPWYGDLLSGFPRCSYVRFRSTLSVTSGAPVSTSARARRGRLRDDGVRGEALVVRDVPREAGVLERALREDVRLAEHVGHDERRRLLDDEARRRRRSRPCAAIRGERERDRGEERERCDRSDAAARRRRHSDAQDAELGNLGLGGLLLGERASRPRPS